mmetsp:Transcript_83150/g.165017  ORF Transcript_83150/g.165017 Transcript_83150/m.165017 type:complete len:277 (-) Transcript_83150:52-882(-)
MAPVKFDDISKTASEVLNDDFKTSGYEFKAKQKTTWDGAVVTSTFDLFPSNSDIMTPAKLSWKLPTPLKTNFVCIDKLEMDKAGKFKLEASTDKLYEKLKVDAKSDLKDPAKISAGLTYSGVPDTLIKFETTLMKPEAFTAEITRAAGQATFGAKFGLANITAPDLGARYAQGPFFGSLLCKEKLSTFNASASYKVSPEVKCAVTADYGGKKSGQFGFGIAYDVVKGTKLKLKVQHDQSLSFSVKHDVAKGFNILAGGKFNNLKKDYSYGISLSVE